LVYKSAFSCISQKKAVPLQRDLNPYESIGSNNNKNNRFFLYPVQKMDAGTIVPLCCLRGRKLGIGLGTVLPDL
jgi:hypothetical protein